MMQITRKRLKKTHASYTLEGTVLEKGESIKNLGVTITNDLRWNAHIINICTKSNGVPLKSVISKISAKKSVISKI